MKFILSGSQMPTAQAPKIPYCGADAATEELLPEPDQNAMRLAELEDENQRLRDDLRHLQSALFSCRAVAAVSSSAQTTAQRRFGGGAEK